MLAILNFRTEVHYMCRMTVRALVVLTVVLTLRVAVAIPHAQALTVGGPGVNPADFRITTFASGLNFPYGMQVLSDGSLLVATSRPNDSQNALWASTGELIRLVDSDGDGVADGLSVLYSGLPGILTGLSVAGNLVFVTSSAFGQERITILRMGATLADGFTFVGALAFAFPSVGSGWEHTTYGSAVRAAPGRGKGWELFFNVGSDANNSQSTNTVTLSGLLSGTLQGASIYKVTVTDTGSGVSVSGLTRIASGLRNATGMAFHPVSGDFYFSDNGIDGLSDPNEPLSADELNVIAANAIGGAVENFGFPSSYTEYRTGSLIGGAGQQPIVAFQPVPSPNGDESEGSTQIAFAPHSFPAAVNNGIFVGFHGKSDQDQATNEENALVYVDLRTRQYFHFISSFEPGIGHPDGLVTTEESLFVADLSSTGFLSGTGVGAGVIYQIKAKPDLAVSALGASPNAKRGTQISVTDTTVNQGGSAGSSQTGFYLASNSSGAGGIRLGGRVIPALSAGSVSSSTTLLSLPADVAPGSYFIVARANEGSSVDERDETNNTKAVAILIKK